MCASILILLRVLVDIIGEIQQMMNLIYLKIQNIHNTSCHQKASFSLISYANVSCMYVHGTAQMSSRRQGRSVSTAVLTSLTLLPRHPLTFIRAVSYSYRCMLYPLWVIQDSSEGLSRNLSSFVSSSGLM